MTESVDAALVLASASPRRRSLLAQIGVPCRVHPVNADESRRPGETPAAYVERLARDKAILGARQWPQVPVLGADTTVAVGGETLGKPGDEEEAVAMLRALSDRAHQVYSGVAVAAGSRLESRISVTDVLFRPLSEAECRAYWRTGEPVDKAGAYAIQGLGAVFVESIRGSYSGVVGLPLAETARLLQSFDIPIWQIAETETKDVT